MCHQTVSVRIFLSFCMKYSIRLFVALLSALSLNALQAEVRPAKVFTDNMVLQQGKVLHVWGTADPGEKVTVKVMNRQASVVTRADGNWQVSLDPVQASSKPVTFRVSGKRNSISLRNVLVGEVWLASGQSNMEYSMHNHPQYCKPQKGDRDYLLHEYQQASNPSIRLLYIQERLDCDTLPTVGWQTLSQESLAPFSAPAYFFAKDLQDSLQVPVGIISSAWGGTTIESWTPREAYLNNPDFPEYRNRTIMPNKDVIGERFQKMIVPMAPLSMRGFLWYQGEDNLFIQDHENYADKQKLLVDNWRNAWQDSTLYFFYAQLAPYGYSVARWTSLPMNWQELPRFWDGQKQCLKTISRSGMIVSTDLPEDLGDIHPSYKWIVGERFCKLALHDAYGRKDLVANGPTFREMHIEGDKVVITFDNVGSGLRTRDGKAPDWFYVVNVHDHYHRAPAEISSSNTIVIDRNLIGPEIKIRFGWDEVAQPNLINSEGLPAVPFFEKLDNMESNPIITNGVTWYDDQNRPVNAHGACIVREKGRYYLFGEYKSDTTNAFPGFSCYSSPDLAHWTFERVALGVQPDGILGPNRVGERVKVMHCPKTGKYVMLMHADDMRYMDPHIGLAVADSINGEYRFIGPLLYQGEPIRRWDMGTFQDNDGRGYLLIHHGPIYRLSDDYLSAEALVANVEGSGEAPTLLHKDSLYYIIYSKLTSWEKNDNFYFTAPRIEGPWTKHDAFCPVGSLTWNSQSTFCLPIQQGDSTTYLYMGDRWSYPHQASSATYVWMPLQVNGDSLSIPQYYHSWNLQTGKPVDLLEGCQDLTLEPDKDWVLQEGIYQSNVSGSTLKAHFKGGRIVLVGQTGIHHGYGRITIADASGQTVFTNLIDCYSKAPDFGPRLVSPHFPEGDYLITVTVTGDHGTWTDKSKHIFGSDDNNVTVSRIAVIK